MSNINLSVNDKQYSLEPMAGETLSTFLRQRLRLTGTKIGCDEAECAACTVLVNGEPVVSCIYPAARADGKAITTIEGLATFALSGATRQGSAVEAQITNATRPSSTDFAKSASSSAQDVKLHPLQEAFVEHGAVQCGFCIPGQIMTSYALLKRNPNPTQD